MNRLLLVALVFCLTAVASGQTVPSGRIMRGYGIALNEPQIEGKLLHVKNLYVTMPDGGYLVADQATYNHESREIRLTGSVAMKMPAVDDQLRFTLQSGQ